MSFNISSWKENTLSRERYPDKISLYDISIKDELEFLIRQSLNISFPIVVGVQKKYKNPYDKSVVDAFRKRVYIQYYNKKYIPELVGDSVEILRNKYLYVIDHIHNDIHMFTQENHTEVCISGFINDMVSVSIESPIWSYEDAAPFINAIIQKILADSQTKIQRNLNLFDRFLKEFEARKSRYRDQRIALSTVATYELSWLKILHDSFMHVFDFKLVNKKRLYPNRVPSNRNLMMHLILSNMDLVKLRTPLEKELLLYICNTIGCDQHRVQNLIDSKTQGIEQFSCIEAAKLLHYRSDAIIKHKLIYRHMSKEQARASISTMMNYIVSTCSDLDDRNMNFAVFKMIFPFMEYTRYGYFFNHPLYNKRTINQNLSKGFLDLHDFLIVGTDYLNTFDYLRELCGRWKKY